MKKQDLLKKMKSEMPAKAPEENLLSMEESDYEVEPMEDEEEMEAAPNPFADASDDDLLAEMKKRGLKMEAEAEEDAEEDAMA